ncbi:MAG: hypothetical protein WC001_05335 [Desulfurivibrionaceae bacterium]
MLHTAWHGQRAAKAAGLTIPALVTAALAAIIVAVSVRYSNY